MSEMSDTRFFIMMVTFLLLGASTSYIGFMALVDKLKKEIEELKKQIKTKDE